MSLDDWTITDTIFLTVTVLTDEEQEEIKKLEKERDTELSSIPLADFEKRKCVNTKYNSMIASIRRNSKGEKKIIECKPFAINEAGELTETSVYKAERR